MIKFPVPAFPKFTRNRILTAILLIGITLTAAGVALAVQANPGHNINTLGGVIQGDVLYGSAADVVSALAKDINATRYLSNTGATNNPAWAQVNVANGITGTVGTANLGSGTANSTTFLRGDQTWATPAAAGAPSTATYITQTADAGLSAEQALSALATGYMKVTTATGVVTSQATPIPAADGGTGLSTFGGTNTVLYTSAANTLTNVTASAAAGQFLQTTASGGAPTWQTLLGVANGGTGVASLTANNVILGNGASGPLFVAPGTAGNLLQSNGTTWTSAAPSAASGLPKYNQSVTTPAAGFAADTYLVGSSIAIVAPATTLKIGSRYHLIFNVSKTAAGLATPILNIRYGTLGTTGDASKCALTFTAQTAVTDTGTFEVWVTFRAVGSGTTAIVQCSSRRDHGASITGLGTLVGETKVATSAGFDSTVANSILGVSVNGGASAAWTITQANATLENIN